MKRIVKHRQENKYFHDNPGRPTACVMPECISPVSYGKAIWAAKRRLAIQADKLG